MSIKEPSAEKKVQAAAEDRDPGLCLMVGRLAGQAVEGAYDYLSRCLGGRRAPAPRGGAAAGAAAEMDDRKEQYLKMVVHQIQSPLNTIGSQLDRIEKNLSGKTLLSPALMDDYFTRIKSSLKHLSGFVDDFVEVSHIEYGLLECKPRPMQFHSVAEEVAGLFAVEAEKQEVLLSNRMDASAERVMGDAKYLRQALSRLVANALKSAKDGGEVWVEAQQREAGGKKFLRISVCDTGCGMDEEDRRMLGEVFAPGGGAGKAPGRQRRSGLGLFIAKVAVEAHNSRVLVEPLPGGGTRVFFDLFCAEA